MLQSEVNAEMLAAQQKRQAQDMAVQGVQAASALLQGLFGENKKIAIGETLISTYLTAQKAFESQFKPLATVDSPARGAVAAAIAVAQGLARVAAIKKTNAGGGGGSGGRGGGGAGAAGQGAPRFTQSVNFLNNAQGSDEEPSRRVPDFVPSSPITNQAAPTVDVNIDRAGLAIAVNRGQQDLLNNSTSI
jgi:hypothetical protein